MKTTIQVTRAQLNDVITLASQGTKLARLDGLGIHLSVASWDECGMKDIGDKLLAAHVRGDEVKVEVVK